MIHLASESKFKISAVNNLMKKMLQDVSYKIITHNCNECKLPEQPIDCGIECATKRVSYVKKILGDMYTHDDIIVGIENDLVNENNEYVDYAHARIEYGPIVGMGRSFPIKCPIDNKSFDNVENVKISDKIKGYRVTGGGMLHRDNTNVPKDNWMKILCNVDRTDQILNALENAYSNLMLNLENCKSLKKYYNIYDNFPKKGNKFCYFYSLFSVKDNMCILNKLLYEKYSNMEIDVVIPLGINGLTISSLLSASLNSAMIPLQNRNEIPGNKMDIGSSLAISLDVFDLIIKNTKNEHLNILLVNDVIDENLINNTLNVLNKLKEEYHVNKTFDTYVFALDTDNKSKTHANVNAKFDILFI